MIGVRLVSCHGVPITDEMTVVSIHCKGGIVVTTRSFVY